MSIHLHRIYKHFLWGFGVSTLYTQFSVLSQLWISFSLWLLETVFRSSLLNWCIFTSLLWRLAAEHKVRPSGVVHLRNAISRYLCLEISTSNFQTHCPLWDENNQLLDQTHHKLIHRHSELVWLLGDPVLRVGLVCMVISYLVSVIWRIIGVSRWRYGLNMWFIFWLNSTTIRQLACDTGCVGLGLFIVNPRVLAYCIYPSISHSFSWWISYLEVDQLQESGLWNWVPPWGGTIECCPTPSCDPEFFSILLLLTDILHVLVLP